MLHPTGFRRSRTTLQSAHFFCACIITVMMAAPIGDARTDDALPASPDFGPPRRQASQHSIVEQEVLDAQFEALNRIRGDFQVRYHENGTVNQIKGTIGLNLPNDASDELRDSTAASVIELVKPLALLRGTEAFAPQSTSKLRNGGWIIRMSQSIRGIAVREGFFAFESHPKTGDVLLVTMDLLPDRGLPGAPHYSGADALATAAEVLPRELPEFLRLVRVRRAPELQYTFGAGPIRDRLGEALLVWTIEFEVTGPNGEFGIEVLINSESNELVSLSPTTHELTPTVFDLQNNFGFGNGVCVCGGGPGGGTRPCVVSDGIAYRSQINAIKAQDSFLALFYRNGLDGQGLPPTLHVHWGQSLGGSDIDSLDVLGHEYTHGVVRRFVGFDLSAGGSAAQGSAAIGESIADVLGTSVDAHQNGSGPATYELAEVYTADRTKPLRSFSNPTVRSGSLGQVDWYPTRDLGTTFEGAQYRNATIGDHAFYLMVHGGQHVRLPTVTVPPLLSRHLADDIWYGTVQRLSVNSDYPALRRESVTQAQLFYGAATADSVRLAWDAVGVTECTTVPATPQFQMDDESCYSMYTAVVSAVLNATKYNVQASPSNFSNPITVADVTSAPPCQGQVGQNTYFRARACNGCGCSSWSSNRLVVYHPWCE